MGGVSAEREVSLSSGRDCAHALRAKGYSVTEMDAGPDLVEELKCLRPDVVFNALHGRWGEDGCVQGVLEWLRIPYTHSGVLASSLAMNKIATKSVFQSAGLPTVPSVLVGKTEAQQQHAMKPPYVVKPYNEGSSVGVYLVHADANGPPKLDDKMPAKVMVEEFIPGRELTTTVMGERALGVTDILTDGWYDYDAKYKDGGSRHVVPAEVPDEIYQACLNYAQRAHDVLGCRGVSRTDFRWDEARGLDGLFLLETNSQPGMTPTSLVPEQAAIQGIPMEELCHWIVEDASCDR